MTEREIPVFKVAFAGDGGVGKTTMIRKFSTGKFQAERMMTIGVDLTTHVLELRPEQKIKLTVWDMAGQDRFAVVRAPFYKGSRVVTLVFDVTNPLTLANLEKWVREVRSFLPSSPLILVANKTDLAGRRIPPQLGRRFADILRAPYFETSCVTGEGIPALFQELGRRAAS